MELLLLLFIAFAVLSGLGVAFLYLSKNQKTKNILFYFLAILSMIITVINATSYPSNFIVQQLIAWFFGFIAIAAIIVKVKKPQNVAIANILVTLSVISSLVDLFLF